MVTAIFFFAAMLALTLGDYWTRGWMQGRGVYTMWLMLVG